MTRAIIVDWSSAYGSVSGLMHLIEQALKQAGVTVARVDLSTPGWESGMMAAIERSDFRFALLSSGIGLDIGADGQNLWARENIPVFCLHLDLPAYRHGPHQTMPPNFVHGYMFRDHAIFQNQYVKAKNLVTSIHYGVPDLPVQRVATERPAVVFPKTGGDPAELERAWRDIPLIAPLLFDLMDEIGMANCASFVPAIAKVGAAHGFEIEPFDKFSRFLLAQIDDYVRRRKSTMLARALIPFPVDVYGRSWEHVTSTATGRARFHGAVAYPVVEAAIAAGGATISMNPNVDLSVHDRFFLAVGAGKIPISDRNQFTLDSCPLLESYMFDFTPDSIATALENYFADPADAADRALSTRAEMRFKFPLEDGVKHIIECARLVHYFEHEFKPPQNFYVAGN